MLDTHCNDCNQKVIEEGNKTPMSSYDFVYLPIDFRYHSFLHLYLIKISGDKCVD